MSTTTTPQWTGMPRVDTATVANLIELFESATRDCGACADEVDNAYYQGYADAIHQALHYLGMRDAGGACDCCPPCRDGEHAGDMESPGTCDCCGQVVMTS